jgi:hypothetical protein
LGAPSNFYVDLGWSGGMCRAREGIGMWTERTIEDPDEWERIQLEAQCADQEFSFSVAMFRKEPDPKTRVLAARNRYLVAKHAAQTEASCG